MIPSTFSIYKIHINDSDAAKFDGNTIGASIRGTND